MEIKRNAAVMSAEGEKIGEVDRVVLNPKTHEITDLIIRKGIFFQTDKVVPINLVAETGEDQVRLREFPGGAADLPDFEEKHYVATDERKLQKDTDLSKYATSLFWYPPIAPTGLGVPGFLAAPPLGEPQVSQPYEIETERNIPAGTVVINEGARVVSADEKDVGKIEKIITKEGADRVTHFVVEAGVLQKTHKLIPAIWISEIIDTVIHLAVSSDVIQQLPDYKA